MDWEITSFLYLRMFFRNITFSQDQFGTEQEEGHQNLFLMLYCKLLHMLKKHSKKPLQFMKLILNLSHNIVSEHFWKESKLKFIWKIFKNIISIFLNLDLTKIILSNFHTEHIMLQKLKSFMMDHYSKNEFDVHILHVFWIIFLYNFKNKKINVSFS